MKLSNALRDLRSEVRRIGQDHSNSTLRDASDLLGVLAQIVEGKDVLKAFGAPGDWGYDTPIGDGLLDALRRARTDAA